MNHTTTNGRSVLVGWTRHAPATSSKDSPRDSKKPRAWQDPGPLQFGNAPRADGSVRGFPVYNEDMTISKTFSLKGDVKMRFAASVGNVFNRTLFSGPNTNFSSPAFGRVSTQANQARSVQFGLRLDY